MATAHLSTHQHQPGSAAPRILIVEANAGPARRRWLEDFLRKMEGPEARAFMVSCNFDERGPWAGVSQLFSELLPEIQAQRPDLIERHSLELVYVLPQLRRSITVQNPNLTDQSPPDERSRNYAADRAFRIVHGLIDLLDSWKSATSPDAPWVIACDDYDAAGAIGSRFFQELMRRRGERLRIRLLIGLASGASAKVQSSFSASSPVEVITMNLPGGPQVEIESAVAARRANELEQKVGDDRIEKQLNLPDLIRLWERAIRPDKALRYRYFGLDLYNTLGLYDDALRYVQGLLPLAFQHAADDAFLLWSIMIKTLMSYIGLRDLQSAFTLAEGDALKFVEHDHSAWKGQLFYVIAMLYARYRQPRDLVKGEEFLDRGLEALEHGNLSEGDLHFQSVFNRNGVAMIRNFQGRHQDAIELCRQGIARLDQHLGAEKHRLHRSVLVYNIAQVYSGMGLYEEAIEYYSAVMELDPNYSEYFNERGSIFLRLGRLKEACTDYLKAIELSPPYFEVFTNLGQCYRRMGAMEMAIETYSRALDLQPNQPLALAGRAKAHEDIGHSEAAIADYTAALAHNADQWEVIASRGVLHYETGNLQAALADFDRALELSPSELDLYQNRATLLTDLGRHREAARDLETALKLNPVDDDKLVLQSRHETALRALESAVS